MFQSWQRVAFEKCICFHKHVYLLYMEQYIFCHPIIYFYRLCFCIYLHKYSIFLFQVCEQCNNVKYEREGYVITVDIEKGMQDGQVSFHSSYFVSRFGVDLSVNLVISTRDSSSLCACTWKIKSYVSMYVVLCHVHVGDYNSVNPNLRL